jgi:hypothetical protein
VDLKKDTIDDKNHVLKWVLEIGTTAKRKPNIGAISKGVVGRYF